MKNTVLKSMRFAVLFLGMIAMLSFTHTSQNEGDKIIGIWLPSNGKAKVKIEKIGSKYYGKIVWLKIPIDPVTKKAKRDKNNPDTSMRNVPLRGYRILKNFAFKGKNLWADGTIYDPENGTTYSCEITMKSNNVLNIRGFIGVKALGRTDTWKRLALKKK